MKHLPFQSLYRPDFEVVEERHGHTRLFPHTEQLPILHRALNLEFRTALPGRISRVDRTSDGFGKILLRVAALMFCTDAQAARTDGLQLYPLLDLDLFTRVSIVQQITTHTSLGPAHRFRFYAGPDFFPEIYLSDKRLVFADHALQRFYTRVPNPIEHGLAQFLLTFYGSPSIGLHVGPGRACILFYHGTVLAFPYKESADEFFITTCLTVNEINDLGLELPPQGFNLHYQLPFQAPRLRHWSPLKMMVDANKCWEKKSPPTTQFAACKHRRWHQTAAYVRDVVEKGGHGPGSQLIFADRVPGPNALEIKPGQTEPQWDDLEGCKIAYPDEDWEAIVADLETQRHVLKRIVS